MKILITGTAGFIGYHLTKRMVSNGDEVVGIDNINDYYDVGIKYGRLSDTGIMKEKVSYGKTVQSDKYSNYRFVKLNLEDREAVFRLFKDERFDVICNLAAQAGVRYSIENPFAYIDSNIVGFVNLLEASRRFEIGHFAYASSSSVYGLNKKMPFSVHDDISHPVSLYAASKKSNELMAHSYSHLYGLPTTGLRLFTVYGPWGRPDMALFKFAKAIIENKPIDVYNYGNMQRDFTYIDDIAEGLARIVNRPAAADKKWNGIDPDPASSSAPYRTYNIGNGAPIELTAFIEAIENALGKKAKKNLMPMQPGDVAATWADTTELENDFGYKPNTSIAEGVGRFISWYRKFYKV